MAIDKELLDKFLKDPTAVPKTLKETYIDLLKQTNKEYEAKEVIKKAIFNPEPAVAPLKEAEKVSSNSNLESSTVHSQNVSQTNSKKISPFFIFVFIVVVIIITVAYYNYNKKRKEKEKVKNEAIENAKAEGQPIPNSYLPTGEEIMNSGLVSAGKNAGILLAYILIIALVMWGLTTLSKQVKNFEGVVTS